MKTYCAMLVTLICLVVVNKADARRVGNLSIVLEGPFVVCENLHDHTLKINIPRLGPTFPLEPALLASHYVPGFTAPWNQRPLGVDKSGNPGGTYYPSHSVDYVMDIPWDSPKKWGNMDLAVPKHNSSDAVYLYNERGDCQSLKLQENKVAVSFTVPLPDEISPIEHAGETSWVTDGNNVPHGPCTKDPCRHATSVVLVYKGVDFESVPVRIHKIGATQKCDAAGNTDAPDTWCPDTSVLTAANFEIKLDAQPKPTPALMLAHLQSAKAFKQAIGLLPGLGKRELTFDGIENGKPKKRPAGMNAPNEKILAKQMIQWQAAYAPRHNNCGSAMVFACTSGNACKQQQ
jgi:hypothetical protein